MHAPRRKATPRARRRRASADDICRALAQAAVDNELPVEFFTRLIWQESRFDPSAVSSKGALGIAQFMPGTASARGLADPLEPLQALRELASYLRELRTTFRGNLGLAAAAYNAGPGRVEGVARWTPDLARRDAGLRAHRDRPRGRGVGLAAAAAVCGIRHSEGHAIAWRLPR